MNDLKPCPCCGGEMMLLSEREKLFYAWCTQCGISSKRFTSKEQAIEAMNKRYERTCRMAPNLTRHPLYLCCTSCGEMTREPRNYCSNCGAKVVRK